ncbi:hypothetical protein HH310_06840 [Actinoplanes sp. TBRC 11911]|uniref:hypothetical protein n=1 Tax=Actinoplanes sp. TBRC 11911 TaxID=2729386 RepID=UPI00145D80AB|nr:hypothetical protein [Actinoplanes sp. TBRC 11911]NMO50908.1 hypothetical protein [Actinoplanes sp. TBRC 11911]
MDGVIGTVVLSIVAVGVVVCAVAGLRYGRSNRAGNEPAPRLPEPEPAMPGAAVAAAAPSAAGAFKAVSAPAEPPATEIAARVVREMPDAVVREMPDARAAERRQLSNSGARRFGPTGSNARTIRSIQAR